MVRRESRKFYLFPRKGIFSVQFVDPVTRKCLTAKSTGKTNRDEALVVVYDWLKNGMPQGRSKTPVLGASRPISEALDSTQLLFGLKNANLTAPDVDKIEKILKEKGLITSIIKVNTPSSELFISYLKRFWDYENSPYIKERLSHKLGLTRGYAKICFNRVNRYWKPYFKDQTLAQITRQNLKDFSNNLAENNPKLSANTLNSIRKVGIKALRWAYANTYIPIDPTIRLPGYSSKAKKRGVLSPEEAMRLFQLKWDDKIVLLVNLVGMITGLRVAEILALKMENVGEKYLMVEHSFSRTDGLKNTKNEEEKIVPIMPQIRDALRNLGSTNPYGDGYIFYGDASGQPLRAHRPLVTLKKMLVKLYIKDQKIKFGENDTEKEKRAILRKTAQEARIYWKKRNVLFHSWRHFYSSRMADKLEARKVMLATGHKTESVFKGYAEHALESDLEEVAVTTEEVFGGLLPADIDR
jgi:integrase